MANPPSLWPGLEVFYEGFMDLMSSRQIGFGLGPIWWQTVQDYCNSKGFDDELTDQMHFHIKKMDEVYLTYAGKKKGRGDSSSIQQKHPETKQSNPKQRR